MRLSSTRLVILYVALVSIAVSALLGGVYFFTLRAIEREIETVIEAELDWLLETHEHAGTQQMIETLQRHSKQWNRSGGLYLVADSQFKPLAGNLDQWPVEARTAIDWVSFDIEARDRGLEVEHAVRARVVRLDGGERLLVGTDVSEVRGFLRGFRIATVAGIALTTLLVAVLGWWYSARTAARVREFAESCEQIISGDISRRLPVDGSHDEFDALGAAANRMLDRIEVQTTTLRTTFDSAAHDLRSPLYRLRVRLEQALLERGLTPSAQDAMQAAVTDLDRVQRTLATLLQIAQAESGGAMKADTVDLGALAQELVDLYAPHAREQQLALTCSTQPGVVVSGNRQLLAQLVINLLENALKYVPANGHVLVAVVRQDAGIELSVSDDGPGIAVADRERVMRPFERVNRDAGHGGSGLGLSLAAAVARLHGAGLFLEDNNPGLRVRCVLPLV